MERITDAQAEKILITRSLYKHPWDHWFASKQWTLLKQGVDFTTNIKSLRGQLARAATNRGITVITRVIEIGKNESVMFKVIDHGQ
jgi:hypothetical protein